MLAILNFLLLLVIGLMTWQLRVPLAVALVATIAMAGNPWSHVVGGALLIDTCVGLVVTVAILLFAFEASSKAASGKSAALRGVFAGDDSENRWRHQQDDIRLFCNPTVCAFSRSNLVPGGASSRHHSASFVAEDLSIPGLIVLALYGRRNYFWETVPSSFGSLAPMYADSLTLREFIVGQFMGTGLGGSVLLLMAAAVIVITVRRRAADSAVVLYLLLVLLGYFWLVSNTVNRQHRSSCRSGWRCRGASLSSCAIPPTGKYKGSPVRDFAL